MLDLTPGGVVALAGHKLPGGYLRRAKAYRHGPAAFKVDYALSGPVPWTHPDLARAGTVHLSGTLAEVAGAERSTWEGEPAARPFLLVAQQSAVDPSRAPAGSHTLWVYAHVPHGSNVDVTGHIDQRLEEMAPGFGELVIGRHVMTPADLEAYNPNYRGGDIAGGAHTLGQLVFRPFLRANPYTTPLDGVFLCSASTPPGAGTHGMCGHRAALAALAR
jgi:phytoene dehydrogenase-like protein